MRSNPTIADDPGFITWEYNGETGHYEFEFELAAMQDYFGASVNLGEELTKDSDSDGICDFFDGKHIPPINGINFRNMSATNADSDGDGIADGQELVFDICTTIGRKGKVVTIKCTLMSDPTK